MLGPQDGHAFGLAIPKASIEPTKGRRIHLLVVSHGSLDGARLGHVDGTRTPRVRFAIMGIFGPRNCRCIAFVLAKGANTHAEGPSGHPSCISEPEICSDAMCVHLPIIVCFISPVGFEGNLSLLDIFDFFPGDLSAARLVSPPMGTFPLSVNKHPEVQATRTSVFFLEGGASPYFGRCP